MKKIYTLSEIFGGEPKNIIKNREEAPNNEEEAEKEDKNLHVRVKKMMSSHQCRRLISELYLEKELDWHFERGASYHVISMGDVDSLTYLRHIAKQQHIRYAILSTWCMAMEDIKEIGLWLEKGYVDRIDFFCGEIFRGTYLAEYEAMRAMCHQYGCKMSIFRNHSKVMVVYGDDFDAVIESSANVNTNPRTEQTCITVDTGLCDFYKEFFDGIKSFEREFDYVGIWNGKLNTDGAAGSEEAQREEDPQGTTEAEQSIQES